MGVDNGSRLGVVAGVCRGAASVGFSVGAGMGVGGGTFGSSVSAVDGSAGANGLNAFDWSVAVLEEVGGVEVRAGRRAGSSVAVVLEVISGARVNGVSSTDSAGLVFGAAVAAVLEAGAGVGSTLGSSSGGKKASAVSDGGS